MGHAGILCAHDDRGQRAVDVAEDRGLGRSIGQRPKRLAERVGGLSGHARSMQRVSERLLRLAAIATAAGAFSGLFGVGGGTVIVPLLMLWLAFGEREATGTSLAAIAVIAALAAVGHAVAGEIDVLKGVLIGLPAVAGVVAGVGLQQRIDPVAVSAIFAVFLVASAAYLIL